MKKIFLLILFVIPTILAAQEMRWERIKPISAQVEMTNPLADDMILIQEAATGLRKYVKISNLPHPAESDPDFNAWNKDYADLINKPTIPTNNSQLANGAGYLTSFTETDPLYSAWDKSYNDLTDKPTIPTNNSQLANGAGYLTSFTEVDPLYSAWNKSYNDLINKPTIPTNNSQLANGAGYLTGNQTITLSNDATGSGTTNIGVAVNRISTYDVRGMPNSNGSSDYHPAPNSAVIDRKAMTMFGYVAGTPTSWRNTLAVKGWTGNYAVWELIGNGSTTTDNDLHYRTGIAGTWNTPVKIWHEGNTHNQTHEIGGSDEINVAGLSGVLSDNQPFDNTNIAYRNVTNVFTASQQISSVSPSFYLDESDTDTWYRTVVSGGFSFIQAGAAGAGITASSGNLRITGYGGADIGIFQVRSGSAYRDIYHEGNLPAYPTVNDPVITITGTPVSGTTQAFSMNQAHGETITILDNQAPFLNYAANNNGRLVATNITDTDTRMVDVEIVANGYQSEPIRIHVQLYTYQAGSRFLSYSASGLNYTSDIEAFFYNGFLHFHFPQESQSQTWHIMARTNSAYDINRVTSVTDAAKPSSGTTWDVTITPKKIWNENNLTNVSQLSNDAGYINSTTGNWTGTLDGRNGTDFMYNEGRTTVTDIDDLIGDQSGTYGLTGTPTNLPTGAGSYGIIQNNTNTDVGGQTFWDRVNNEMHFRTWLSSGSTINDWNKIYHSGNSNLATVDWSANNVFSSGYVRATNGTDYAELQYYGLQMNRSTNYIRPTTSFNKNLNIGYTGQEWNTIWVNANKLVVNNPIEASEYILLTNPASPTLSQVELKTYDSSNSTTFGSAAGLRIRNYKTASYGNDNSIIFESGSALMGGISSRYTTYADGGVAGGSLEFYTRTSVGTVEKVLELDKSKNATFANNVSASVYRVEKPGGSYITALSSGSDSWLYFGDGIPIYTQGSIHLATGFDLVPYTTLNSDLGSSTKYFGTSYINDGVFSGKVTVASHLSLNTDGTIDWGTSSYGGRLSWDTGKAMVYANSGEALHLGANGSYNTLVLGTDHTATFAETATATDFVGTALSNVAPSADQTKLNGYGLLGNRSALYITNKVGGAIALGVGGTHASNTVLSIQGIGITATQDIDITQSLDAHVGAPDKKRFLKLENTVTFGTAEVGLQLISTGSTAPGAWDIYTQGNSGELRFDRTAGSDHSVLGTNMVKMTTMGNISAHGKSTSWGVSSGELTGAFNTIMGTGASATWLMSATSGGVFRSGIQSLDSNGALKVYSNGGYISISGTTITTSGTISGATIAGTTNGNHTGTIQNYLTTTSEGKIHANSTTHRRAGMYGVYDSYKIGHIWSMGSAYDIAADGSDFGGSGGLYGAAYYHVNNGAGTFANGHQMLWVQNGVPTSGMGNNLWTSGYVIADNIDANGNTTGNAVTATTASNSLLLGGAAPIEASTASTIAKRTTSGDINARLFKSEYASTNGTVNFIMTQKETGTGDNYIRPTTPAQFRTAVTDDKYIHKNAISGSVAPDDGYFNTTATTSGIKVRLPFSTSGTKMVAFDVRVYQGYHSFIVNFSGYLYANNDQWLNPRAIMMGGSTNIAVKMGRDTDGRAYVWLAGGSYTGVAVQNVMSGWYDGDWNSGWEIIDSATTPNEALSSTVYPNFTIKGGTVSGNITAPTFIGNVTGNLTGTASLVSVTNNNTGAGTYPVVWDNTAGKMYHSSTQMTFQPISGNLNVAGTIDAQGGMMADYFEVGAGVQIYGGAGHTMRLKDDGNDVSLSDLVNGNYLWNESVGYNMVYPKSARKVVSGDYADGAYMDGIAPLIADFGIVSDGNDFVNIRFNHNNGTLGTTIYENVGMPDLSAGGEDYLLGIKTNGEVVEVAASDYTDYIADVWLQGDDLNLEGVGEGFFGTIDLSGVSSDFRRKKNFRTLNNSLDKILAINTYAFDWKERDSIPRIAEDVEINVELDTDSEQRESAGIIAQELIEIIPEAVITGADGYQRIKTDAIVPHLIEAMKTQQSQLSEQQKQIDELKKQIEKL